MFFNDDKNLDFNYNTILIPTHLLHVVSFIIVYRYIVIDYFGNPSPTLIINFSLNKGCYRLFFDLY